MAYYSRTGGTHRPLHDDERNRANWNKFGDPDNVVVKADSDNIKPFNLVYVDRSETYPSIYVKNCDALYGKDTNEGDIWIVELRMIRDGTTNLHDKETAFKANQSAQAFRLNPQKEYNVRAAAASITHGDILVCNDDGTVQRLADASVGSSAFRSHAFVAQETKTTTSTSPLILAKYVGLISVYGGTGTPTTPELKGIFTTTPFMQKSNGTGEVGQMKVIQYPHDAPALTGVTFESSAVTVATVDASTGVITAAGNGTCYVTATKDSFKAVCIVVISGVGGA